MPINILKEEIHECLDDRSWRQFSNERLDILFVE